jgi:hypothetical protein
MSNVLIILYIPVNLFLLQENKWLFVNGAVKVIEKATTLAALFFEFFAARDFSVMNIRIRDLGWKKSDWG